MMRSCSTCRWSVAEKLREADWQPKSSDENTAILRISLELAGDIPIHTLHAAVARHVKQQLPPNVRKDPCYRKMALVHVIATKPDCWHRTTTEPPSRRRVATVSPERS